MAALGFTVPNAAAEALQHQGARAGSASALMGTLQFLLGAVFGGAAAVMVHGSPVPLAVLILAGALGSLAAEKWRRA
jgi:DHA1 family bicyclomycin/chloramphenicol resistance-like MFS transporter